MNPTQVVEEARGMARRFFAKRGNHTEVHLDEYDLMILLGVAISRGMDLNEPFFVCNALSHNSNEGCSNPGCWI